jgi:Skp family chaperone for outer membrane proteins
MRNRRTWVVTGLLTLALAGVAAAAGGKIGAVDMARLIKAHPDARAAEVTMKKYMDEFEAEQKRLVEDLEKLKADFDKTREESQNKALSEEAQERKKKDAEEKFAKLREFDQKAREAISLRQKQISDQHKRLREGIVAKLQKAIREYADKNGYMLVLNSSNVGTGAEAVVYSSDAADLTAEITKQIGGESKETKDVKE